MSPKEGGALHDLLGVPASVLAAVVRTGIDNFSIVVIFN